MAYDRYQWWYQGGLDKTAGQMPAIMINESEETPAINYVSSIGKADFCDNLAQGTVDLKWIVENSPAYLVARRSLSNPQLKTQFRENPEIAELVAAYIVSVEEFHDYKKNLETETRLTRKQIPQYLVPCVQQIDTWNKFVEQHQRALHLHPCDIQDDWYIVAIRSHDLRLRKSESAESSNADTWEEYSSWDWDGFEFDPDTQPPTVTDEEIFWRLPDQCVIVGVSHRSSTKEIAEYYGYSDLFDQYQAARTRERTEMSELQKQISREKADSSKKKRADLVSRLLEP